MDLHKHGNKRSGQLTASLASFSFLVNLLTWEKLPEKTSSLFCGVFRGAMGAQPPPGPVLFMDLRGFSGPNGCWAPPL